MSEEKKDGQVEQLKKDFQVIKDFLPRVLDFVKEHKRKLIILGAVLVALGALFTYKMIHYTSEPEFCNLFCHEMTPEVESWENSFHSQRGVDCKECHYGEGIMGVVKAKYYAQFQLLHHITGSYSNNPL